MVPGPVNIDPAVLEIANRNYGSADLEKDFLDLYNKCEKNLQEILKTKNKIVIQSGEGMLALWSAMKSCLLPGDKVLCIATGVFGHGFEQMAKSIGCECMTIGYEYNESVKDFNRIEDAIKKFSPKMITVVQNETPSGTMNSMEEIALLKEKYKVALLYVDAVSGIAGSEVLTDKWNIDLCLGASQKCLSAPANMAFLSVSEKAWGIIEEIKYVGYDALLPFKTAQENFYFPYTMDWHAIAQLNKACEIVLEEGLDNCIARHDKLAKYCRKEIIDMGLELFIAKDALPSPTLTAVMIPRNTNWETLDKMFREKGLIIGGSYGPLSGKIFRIGHMGTQANEDMLNKALKIIREVTSCIS
jgi:aspartate aminotransferase-like enzyme